MVDSQVKYIRKEIFLAHLWCHVEEDKDDIDDGENFLFTKGRGARN